MDNRSDYYVYQIAALDGTPVYVGAGCERRWLRHTKQSRNARLAALVAAGGTLAPVKIREGLTKAEAFAGEVEAIAEIGRADKGAGTLFNLTDGGAGAPGSVPSALTRAKMANASRGWKRAAMSAEQRAALRLANLGKKHSEATLAAMSAARLGKPKSVAHRAAISAAKLGKPLSVEHRAALSAAKLGEKRGPYHKQAAQAA